MVKPLRIVLASVGVLLALCAVLLAAQQATMTYVLPVPETKAQETPYGVGHTIAYGPGVMATVVAVVMALVTIGWLVANAVGISSAARVSSAVRVSGAVGPSGALRISKPWLWAIPVVALIISYVVTLVVMGMNRPVF